MAKAKTAKAMKDITERVKSYEDACKIRGMIPLTIEQFNFLPEDQREAMYGFHRTITVIDVLNEDWVPDWNNDDEYKYYPWFDMETYRDAPSASGFSYYGYNCDFTLTIVGARLVLKTAALAEYVGKQFVDDYRMWMR